MTIRKVARGAPDPNQNGAKEFVDAYQVFRGLRDRKIATDQANERDVEKNRLLARKALTDELSTGFESGPDGNVGVSQDYFTPGTPMHDRAAQEALFKHPPKGGGTLLTAGQYQRIKDGIAKGTLDEDLKDLPLSPSYGFGNQKMLEPGASDEMLRGIVAGTPLPGNPQIPKAAIPLYRKNPSDIPIDPQQQADWEGAVGARPGSGKNLRVGNFASGMSQAAALRGQDARQEKALNNAATIAQNKIDEKKRIAAEKQARADEESARTAGIVTEDIDRALEAAKASQWAVGPLVGQTHRIPGTPAYNLNNLIDTIKANVAFDKLQKMRAASPTGGALGNVSDFENKMLQGTAGKLDVTMDQKDFEQNMNRLRKQYDAVINRGVQPGDPDPDLADPSEENTGNPSDRRAKGVDRASSAKALGVSRYMPAIDKIGKIPEDQKTLDVDLGVLVRNRATGKVGTIPKDRLDAALKSGRFERAK